MRECCKHSIRITGRVKTENQFQFQNKSHLRIETHQGFNSSLIKKRKVKQPCQEPGRLRLLETGYMNVQILFISNIPGSMMRISSVRDDEDLRLKFVRRRKEDSLAENTHLSASWMRPAKTCDQATSQSKDVQSSNVRNISGKITIKFDKLKLHKFSHQGIHR